MHRYMMGSFVRRSYQIGYRFGLCQVHLAVGKGPAREFARLCRDGAGLGQQLH